MKRALFFFAILILFTTGVQTQRGRTGIGVSFDYGMNGHDYNSKNMAVMLKFRYYISDIFEVVPSAAYFLNTNCNYDYQLVTEKDFKIKYGFGVNVNSYFSNSRLRPYAIVGVHGYDVDYPEFSRTTPSYYENGVLISGEKETISGKAGYKVAGNIGFGASYRISYSSNLNLEIGYDTYLGTVVSLGYSLMFK